MMLVVMLGAVPHEIRGLVEVLKPEESFRFLGSVFHMIRKDHLSLILGVTGLGKVNGALVTSAVLERFSVDQVWNIGCAGAYGDGPLNKGDVLISTDILLGDEGVLTCREILSTQEIGIPVLEMGYRPLYASIPLGDQPGFAHCLEKTSEGVYECDGALPFSTDARKAGSCRSTRFKVVHGPSLTVSMVSGDKQTATHRFRRYGAFGENMEGSGVAQACIRHGVLMMECRGMSNLAGDRDKARWDFERAFAHCHTIMLQWLADIGLYMSSKKQ